MSKVKKVKILKYTVLFEPAEEGGYVVSVPKLYGLTTEGDTFEEAQSMARDVIKGYVESLIESGKEVPIEPEEKTLSVEVSVPIDVGSSNPIFA